MSKKTENKCRYIQKNKQFAFAMMLILCFCFSSQFAYTQAKQDSVQLNANGLPIFKPDEGIDDDKIYDYGFFPKKQFHFWAVGLNQQSAFHISSNSNISSPSIGAGNMTFTDESPFADYDFSEDDYDEREITKQGEIDEYECSYPTESFGSVGLNLYYYSPLPINLKLGVVWDYDYDNLFFSSNKAKKYLASDGYKQDFKEVHVLYLEEECIDLSAGLMIDLWGGSMGVMTTGISSHYYLYMGYAHKYVVSRQATLYSQIADAKENLRYDNMCDTIQYYKERHLNNINKNRAFIDVGLGMDFSVLGTNGKSSGGFMTDINLLLRIPQNSIFIDTDYKNWQISLGVTLGFAWN